MSEEKIRQAADIYIMSEGGETQRMYGHHLRSFKAGVEWALNQPQQSPVKTLDELVEKHLHFEGKTNDKWYLRASIKNYLEYGNVSGSFWEAIKSIVEESQPVPVTDGREWIMCKGEITPEIGAYVEVVTEYVNKGNPETSRFIGYMDDLGDLFSMPESDSYGWTFKECVKMWRYLTQLPTH